MLLDESRVTALEISPRSGTLSLCYGRLCPRCLVFFSRCHRGSGGFDSPERERARARASRALVPRSFARPTGGSFFSRLVILPARKTKRRKKRSAPLGKIAIASPHYDTTASASYDDDDESRRRNSRRVCISQSQQRAKDTSERAVTGS